MKIWNLFEQSGTFKSVERDLGYESYDIDIINTLNVDYNIDIFKHIDNYVKDVDLENNIFNKIQKDDLVMSFFPCTRFENQANMLILANQNPIIYKSPLKRIKYSQEREREREV